MSYESTVLGTAGLVGYWPLNEASGTEAKDGKSTHPGTYSGTLTLGSEGPLPGSKAAHFTGGKMAVPDTAALRLGSAALSLECWFKADAVESANLSLIDNALRAYSIFLNTNAGHEWLVFLGATGKTKAVRAVKKDTWYHLALVSSGTELKVYINGVIALTSEFTAGATNSNDGVTFAGNPSGGGAVFQGYGCGLGVYNVALSAATVEAHWSVARAEIIASESAYAQLIRNTPGLMAYWRGNEKSGTTAIDREGRANGEYKGPAKKSGEEYGYALAEPGFINGDSTAGSVDYGGGESHLVENNPGYIELGSKVLQSQITTEFTIESWVELRKNPNANEACLYDNSLDAANLEDEQAGYALAIQYENRVVLFMSDSGPGPPTEYWADKAHALELHRPYHIAITFKAGKGRIYVNGKEVPGVLGAWNQPQGIFEVGAGVPGTSLGAKVSFVPGCGEPPRIAIAGGGSAGQGYDFTGRQGELAVYNVALNAAAIEERAAAGVTATASFPLSHHNRIVNQ